MKQDGILHVKKSSRYFLLQPLTLRSVGKLAIPMVAVVGLWASPVSATRHGGSSTATIHVMSPVKPVVSSVKPNAGPTTGGQAINIAGTGFVKGAKVEIGQGKGAGPTAIVASHVVVVSSKEISAITGGRARAGRWDLFVITVGGTSAINDGDKYRYEGGGTERLLAGPTWRSPVTRHAFSIRAPRTAVPWWTR
jgi:hypothetical protein